MPQASGSTSSTLFGSKVSGGTMLPKDTMAWLPKSANANTVAGLGILSAGVFQSHFSGFPFGSLRIFVDLYYFRIETIIDVCLCLPKMHHIEGRSESLDEHSSVQRFSSFFLQRNP